MRVHDGGVQHGDFSPRNVVVDNRGHPFILDFSHANGGHKCAGTGDCSELRNAMDQLGLAASGEGLVGAE